MDTARRSATISGSSLNITRCHAMSWHSAKKQTSKQKEKRRSSAKQGKTKAMALLQALQQGGGYGGGLFVGSKLVLQEPTFPKSLKILWLYRSI